MSEILDAIDNLSFDNETTIDPPYPINTAEHQQEWFETDEDTNTDSDIYSDDDSLDSELALINAQLQWEESLDQLKTLVAIVILPLIGKMIGRKTAGFIWRKLWDTFY